MKPKYLLTYIVPAVMAGLLAAGQPARAETAAAKLIVGDSAAKHLYVYAVPSLTMLADFGGIAVGGHAGTIPLRDGRVLIAEETEKQLVVLNTASDRPEIAARIPMPLPADTRYGWTAVDPSGRYFLATSDDDAEAVERLTIVDLQTKEARQLRVDVGAPSAEFGVTVGGQPAMVAFHLADRVDLYPLAALTAPGGQPDDIIDGRIKPVDTLAIGKGGHSDSFSAATGAWTGSTTRGLEIAKIRDGKFAGAKTLSWDAGNGSGGRNPRQRLTTDGRVEFGPLNAPLAPEKWVETQNDLHWVDLETESVARTPLAGGLVGRGGVSARYAVYSNIHPDGDFANLVDLARTSASFRQVVARVPLDRLTRAPASGSSPAKAESRYAAITPDGNLAFVTHGGDGAISVIDTAAKKVIGKIATPTPLKGGGYITAVAAGMPVSELSGR